MRGRRPVAWGARLALLHALLIGAIGFHLMLPFLRRDDTKTDFSSFYLSALEVWRDGNPYASRLVDPFGDSIRAPGAEPIPDSETPAPIGNLNPPFQTVLMAPLGKLDYDPAMWIWYALSLASGIAAGFVMAGTWLPERPLRIWGPALAIAMLLYFPSAANAWIAQYGLVIALVAALSFWFLARGRHVAVGVTLGLAAGLKVFLGLFGVLFLLTRQWRALAGFTAAFLASVLLGGLALGWETYPQYLDMLGQVTWHSSSWNVSVFGTATRLLGSAANDGAILNLPGAGLAVGRAVAVALGIAYVGVVILAERRRDDLPLAMSFTFVMMILLSPLGWWYYLPALLPSCAALVASASSGRERRVSVAAVSLFLIFSSVPQRLYMSGEIGAEGYDWWKSEMPVVALLILAGAHVWIMLRARRLSAADARSVTHGPNLEADERLRSAGA
jgi:hypothetical protein